MSERILQLLPADATAAQAADACRGQARADLAALRPKRALASTASSRAPIANTAISHRIIVAFPRIVRQPSRPASANQPWLTSIVSRAGNWIIDLFTSGKCGRQTDYSDRLRLGFSGSTARCLIIRVTYTD